MYKSINVKWAETLPPGCPPADAIAPNNSAFYRLVDQIPPLISDFASKKQLQPNQAYNDECIARAVSLFDKEDLCIRNKKLPMLKDKKVLEIILPSNCGLIKQTFKKGHWSWWRFGDFDIVKHCMEFYNKDKS